MTELSWRTRWSLGHPAGNGAWSYGRSTTRPIMQSRPPRSTAELVGDLGFQVLCLATAVRSEDQPATRFRLAQVEQLVAEIRQREPRCVEP